MQKKWVTYLVIAVLLLLIESLSIWMGTEEIFNIIHLEGRQIWIFFTTTRIFLWVLTTTCEVFAIGRTYYWPSSSIRSYMLLLFSLYFGFDFLMPLTLSMFPEITLAPFIFGALALLCATLMILSFVKDKVVTLLLAPSLIFMVMRVCLYFGLVI